MLAHNLQSMTLIFEQFFGDNDDDDGKHQRAAGSSQSGKGGMIARPRCKQFPDCAALSSASYSKSFEQYYFRIIPARDQSSSGCPPLSFDEGAA